MAQLIETPAFSEPELLNSPLIDGCEMEIGTDFIRCAAWVLTMPLNPNEAAERRIVLRCAVPIPLVRTLIKDAQKLLAKGGN